MKNKIYNIKKSEKTKKLVYGIIVGIIKTDNIFVHKSIIKVIKNTKIVLKVQKMS